MTIAIIEATGNISIYGSNNTYATARSTGLGTDSVYFLREGLGFTVGQEREASSPYYKIYRGFLSFDTSAIPAAATISKVNIRLVAGSDASTLNDFDIQIVEQSWSSIINYDANFDGCLSPSSYFLWRNTSGMATKTQYTGANMTTAYVNKSGLTTYSLRSSRDKNNNAPASVGYEHVGIFGGSATKEAYRSVLIVEYSEPFIPQVIWM